MKVQCPICKRCCHQTNEKFNPDVHPNGGMIDLLDPWKTYGWGKFGEYDYGGSAVMWSDMLCPVCQAQLAPSGRLTLMPDDHQEVPKPKTLEQRNQEEMCLMWVDNEDWEGVWCTDAGTAPDLTMNRLKEMFDNARLPQERMDAEFNDKDVDPVDEPISSLTSTRYICPECGWTGKTEASLKRHKTMKRHN